MRFERKIVRQVLEVLDADGGDAQACMVLKIVTSNQFCAVCQSRRSGDEKREANGGDEDDEGGR